MRCRSLWALWPAGAPARSHVSGAQPDAPATWSFEAARTTIRTGDNGYNQVREPVSSGRFCGSAPAEPLGRQGLDRHGLGCRRGRVWVGAPGRPPCHGARSTAARRRRSERPGGPLRWTASRATCTTGRASAPGRRRRLGGGGTRPRRGHDDAGAECWSRSSAEGPSGNGSRSASAPGTPSRPRRPQPHGSAGRCPRCPIRHGLGFGSCCTSDCPSPPSLTPSTPRATPPAGSSVDVAPRAEDPGLASPGRRGNGGALAVYAGMCSHVTAYVSADLCMSW